MTSVQENPKTRFAFRLRTDMPRGFVSNDDFPELPAIHKYLRPYNDQSFDSPEQFQAQVLDGFLGYLNKEQISVGSDPKLREGLKLERLQEKIPDRSWDYMVSTPATNNPGCCVFGGLEIISE